MKLNPTSISNVSALAIGMTRALIRSLRPFGIFNAIAAMPTVFVAEPSANVTRYTTVLLVPVVLYTKRTVPLVTYGCTKFSSDILLHILYMCIKYLIICKIGLNQLHPIGASSPTRRARRGGHCPGTDLHANAGTAGPCTRCSVLDRRSWHYASGRQLPTRRLVRLPTPACHWQCLPACPSSLGA
eukprot:SAG22_NODE_154_length_17189_cov_38.210064_11_plen_185_part_00